MQQTLGVGDAVDLELEAGRAAPGLGRRGAPRQLRGGAPARTQDGDRGGALANHAILGANFWRDRLEDATAAGDAARKELGEHISATKVREFHTLGTVLGVGYEGSPIVAAEDGPAPERDGRIYRPTARPGYLAPHAWLADGRSLYDAFGPGFALVVADGADEAQIALAVAEARELGAPLEVVRPWGSTADLYQAELTLVRPGSTRRLARRLLAEPPAALAW